MLKNLLTTLIFLCSLVTFGQIEKYPVFPACDTLQLDILETCFKNELKKAVVAEMQLPEVLTEDGFSGVVNIVFVVRDDGTFNVLYVNTPYKELKEEATRVFDSFEAITPAKFNNHPVEMQFVFPLAIPLTNNQQEALIAKTAVLEAAKDAPVKSTAKSLFPEVNSELNIPFVHDVYDQIEGYLNQGANTHTAVKPYVYTEVKEYVDLEAQKTSLLQDRKTWFGRKWWNEHFALVQGEDFWFTFDIMADLQMGRDTESELNTFNNTRAVNVTGGIGKKLNFYTSFYESQGRFAEYFNDYARSIKPDGGNPAVIPGRGIAKEYDKDAFDYPVAEAYLSYTPSKFFNFQFGHGKNFIGDGYRSLFLSDVASPYPYFKINTKFWNIKYTNLWMTLQDVRPELTEDGAYRQKYVALKYLSWNITKKFNLGLFEAAVWDDVNDRGFDINYLNPLIFYTAIEFATGSRAGNSLIGLSGKYKHKSFSFYSQLVFDEFRFGEMFSSESWWANKFGWQLGAKYHNAFNVDKLMLQAEYNVIRPYTYSHDELNYNYGHNNQPLAHLWGANLRELIAIARYSQGRWFANAKLVFGERGLDFNTPEDPYSYGGDIFRDNDDRKSDYNNKVGQGNSTDVFIGDLQVGYLINPATNLKLFGGITYRDFNPMAPTAGFNPTNTTWISVGLRTDMFNWYFDF